MEYIKNIQLQKVMIGNGWANGKSGQFKDFDRNYQYRFCETDESGFYYLLNDEDQRKTSVFACGFVAWLIKHWGTDTQTIYSGYLYARLNQYKYARKNDADVLKRDLDNEFFEEFNSDEEKLVLQSEAIFDFISEFEAKKIKEYVRCFFEYSESKTNPLKISEYSNEGQIISCSTPYIKEIFNILKKNPEIGDFPPLIIINDLRRIEHYFRTKPDECVEYIASKYKMRLTISTLFIECIKLIIDSQSKFMYLLMIQPFILSLLKNVQNNFAIDLNILIAENKGNSTLTIANKPAYINSQTESLNNDSYIFKIDDIEEIISKIHEKCNNNIFICHKEDFANCIKTADFTSLQIKTKSKVKLLIYYLSKKWVHFGTKKLQIA